MRGASSTPRGAGGSGRSGGSNLFNRNAPLVLTTTVWLLLLFCIDPPRYLFGAVGVLTAALLLGV